jgi:hypothetical protein
MKYLLPVFILLFTFAVSGQPPKAPNGWRFPTIKDIKGNWKDFKKDLTVPYKIKADFNGDKLIDEVWILIPTSDKGSGLFAFLRQKNNSFRALQLEYVKGGNAQQMYISIAEPAKYVTACGKGYWDCSSGEPATIRIKTRAIVYGAYESAMSFYYWDDQAKSFKNIAISD